LMYNEGISREGEILALGEKMGLISKSGATYKYGEEVIGRGYDATRTALRENKKLNNELLTKIRKFMKEEGFSVAPTKADTEDEKPPEE